MTEERPTQEPCSGCAFRAGSEASTYLPTQITARLCVLSGEVFECHELGRRSEPCAGWRRAMAKGKTPPAWKSEMATRLLELWNAARAAEVTDEEAVRRVMAITGGVEEL